VLFSGSVNLASLASLAYVLEPVPVFPFPLADLAFAGRLAVEIREDEIKDF
jgi:hypothetical protein